MERWIKYGSCRLNISQVRSLSVERMRKEDIAYCANMTDTRITKDKKWRLSADHTFIGAFKDKPEALRVADDIIDGRYDCKK